MPVDAPTAAAAVFALAGAAAAAAALRGLLLRQRRQARRRDEARRHEDRLARLRADPARRRYVPLIEAGEHWRDEQIDYDLDPRRTATCAHLAGVERAMRAAGIEVRLVNLDHVQAACRVDRSALAALPAGGAAAMYFEPGASPHPRGDPAQALFWCREHGARLAVVHPDDAAPGTPVFPAGAGEVSGAATPGPVAPYA